MDALDRLSAAERHRLPAVGRGAVLDLHRVSGVVLVDVLDHGAPGLWTPPGHAVVLVWVRAGEGWERRAVAVWAAVRGARDTAAGLALVVRQAGVLERARAWWRRQVWTTRRWAWERGRGR